MGAPRRRAAAGGRARAHALQRRRRSRPAATARRSASCARRTRAIPSLHVWVGETRPLLQGARLTAWELAEDGIPHTLIADVAAGQLFARGLVDAVVFGADRIARNGDAANKIGSYTLSVLAAAHGVPCYVVAPSSTIDHAIASGAEIPIEERAPRRGRAARRTGGRARRHAGLEPRLRRHAGGQHHGDRHRGGRPPRALRAEPAGRRHLTADASGTVARQTPVTGPRRSLAPCPRSPRCSASCCRAAAPPAGGRASGCATTAVSACARWPRRCARAAARRRRSRWAPAAPARACAGSTTARSALWLDGPVLDLVVALEARRDLAGAAGRGARRPRAAAAAGRRARGRAGGARPRCSLRGADPPAELAARARALVGAAGRAARAPHARRAPAARPRRERAPAQRARTRSPRARDRARWRSSTTSTRRARPSTSAPARCAGRAPSTCTWSRSRARHAIGPLLGAAPWQTPSYDVPERGGT